jgi:hypothetical protein
MKDIFYEELPETIGIKDGEILDETPPKEAVLKIDPTSKELDTYDYDNSEPLDENGQIILFDTSNTDKNDSIHRKRTENRKKNKKSS